MRITVQNRILGIFAFTLSLMNITVSGYLMNKFDGLKTTPETVQKAVFMTEDIMVDPALVQAMITIESSGNPSAYNTRTGAVGLLQLRPIIYGKLCGLTKEQAFDPDKNVACGTLFFSQLLKQHKGNVERALLHYNNGLRVSNYEYSKKVLKEKSLTK